MDKNYAAVVLGRCSLFDGFRFEGLRELLATDCTMIRDYTKNQRIFDEGDTPEHIMILLSGSVLIGRDTVNGRGIQIARIERIGDLFGEIYVFSGIRSFDMFGEAQEDTSVLFLSPRAFEPGIVHGLDPRFSGIMNLNLTRIFAQKAYGMNRRLRILASSSIREKIARYLLDQRPARMPARMQAVLDKYSYDPEVTSPKDNVIRVMPREAMADYLNVTRPSLSRELGKMGKEGILKLDSHWIIILDEERLEECL